MKLLLAAFVCLCLAQALALLSPMFWLSDVLSEFACQFLVCFGLSAALFVLMRRWRAASVAFIGVLFNGWMMLPFYMSAPSLCDECESDELTIAQFNLFYRNASVDAFVRWCETQSDIDLVVLSEAQTNADALAGLRKIFPYEWGVAEEYPSGLAVFSRLPIENTALIPMRAHGLHDRDVLRFSVTTRDKRITAHIYAVHLMYSVTPRTWRQRNDSLDELALHAQNHMQPHTLIVGDMNMSAWHPALREAEARSGLRNAQNGHGYAPSWFAGEYRTWLNGLMIDHLLVSPDIAVTSRDRGDDFGSDHVPVISRLRLVTSAKGG